MESAEAILENENNSNVESESHIRLQISNSKNIRPDDNRDGNDLPESSLGSDFSKSSSSEEQDSTIVTLKNSGDGSPKTSKDLQLENDELFEKSYKEEVSAVAELKNVSEDLLDNTTDHDSMSSMQKGNAVSDDVTDEVLRIENKKDAGILSSARKTKEENLSDRGESQGNVDEGKISSEDENSAKNDLIQCDSDVSMGSKETDPPKEIDDSAKEINDDDEELSLEKHLDTNNSVENHVEEYCDGSEPPILTKEPEIETLLQFSPLGEHDLAPESLPKIESYVSEGEKDQSSSNNDTPMDVGNGLCSVAEEPVTNTEGMELDEESEIKVENTITNQEEEDLLLDEDVGRINKETDGNKSEVEMEVESKNSYVSEDSDSNNADVQQKETMETAAELTHTDITEQKESQEVMEFLLSSNTKEKEVQEGLSKSSDPEVSKEVAPTQDLEISIEDDQAPVLEMVDEKNCTVKELDKEKSVERAENHSESLSKDNDICDLDGIPQQNESNKVNEVENPVISEMPILEKNPLVNSSSEETLKSEEDESSKADCDLVIKDIKKEIEIETHTECNEKSASNEVKKEILSDKDQDETEVVVLDDNDDSESVSGVKNESHVRKESDENGTVGQIAAVSGEEYKLHSDHVSGTAKNSSDYSGKVEKMSNKSKTQKCIVCEKITKCKFNIVRGGDTKQLCDDICFKKFRKSPASFLSKPPPSCPPPQTKLPHIQPKPPASVVLFSGSTPTSLGVLTTTASSTPPAISSSSIPAKPTEHHKTCSVCKVMNFQTQRTFCNWKGFDFCGEICLGKFQSSIKATCSNCFIFVPNEIRASYCIKIGNIMHPFCKQSCVQEFMKKLRTCACCKHDLSSVTPVIASVGSDDRPKEFCSSDCVKKLQDQVNDVEIVHVEPSKGSVDTCSVCNSQSNAVKHTVRYHSKTFKLCSDICLSAFQYTNKIHLNKCSSCGSMCTAIEAQAHFIQFEGVTKRFCSDRCIGTFRAENRKLTACTWCAARKVNFDMIERQDENKQYQLFCSLNCLSLFRVNLQAKSNQAVECDKCKKIIPAQYHLTMSDASVRNFCSYACVMAFQSQFNRSIAPPIPPPTSQKSGQPPPAPKPVTSTALQQQLNQKSVVPPLHPHGTRNRGRKPPSKVKTPQNVPAASSASSIPVISSVMSLATEDVPLDNSAGFQLQEKAVTELLKHLEKRGSLVSGDGKQRILVESPLPKMMKNKALQCKPICQTKATACRPHSQNKEIQTDENRGKPVIIPVPVPIYIPMPTVMYSAPTPVPVPIPIPIPVPIFIPTTRKSATGILKTIKDIQERMPADPLEAEILMMAEAVATDKKTMGDSDTDSETDVGDYDANTDEADSKTVNNDGMREKGGAEDMIQMALRMAEEMSGPVEDLEASVQPVAVNSAAVSVPPRPVEQPNFDQREDPDYIPVKSGRGRGAKRPSRGRPEASSRPKRQRTGRNYSAEPDVEPEEQQPVPIINVPPLDTNYRLKFTYGVNAWKHWVVSKNAELEHASKKNSKIRPLPLDVLKCTMDELHFSLCLFIKEVRKPNGEPYSPDSIYYLCLGIQQYLYENGRIDNIFTDLYFQRFTDSLHEVLKTLQPKVNNQGQMLCRIEEEHLWESKQLGAHSPYVLLNTLIYFHTKHFILKTATDHMSLSFAQILKHMKKGVPVKGSLSSSSAPKNASLRFYCLANKKQDNAALRKNKEGGVPVYEVTENFENPLRCPVKLYEFFLSKCPESIKNRNDIFYPVPERSCVPDSPVWYSTQSIEHHTMDKMLTRILLVREIQEAHLHAQPTYIKM